MKTKRWRFHRMVHFLVRFSVRLRIWLGLYRKMWGLAGAKQRCIEKLRKRNSETPRDPQYDDDEIYEKGIEWLNTL